VNRSERRYVGPSSVTGWPPGGLSARIAALRPASSRERADAIRDVIDGFRQLHGSVHRFVQMLAAAAQAGSVAGAVAETDDAAPLQTLLSTLARQLDTVGFARRQELKRAIRDARRLEHMRDAIFFDTLGQDCEALRTIVARLERVDATFVGLCVEHVLEQHRLASSACAVSAE
jgi:hypothetical protein